MKLFCLFLTCLFPTLCMAATSERTMDLTLHAVGYWAIALFALAYVFVIVEEFIHLPKSTPVMLAAGIIWAIIAWEYQVNGIEHAAEEALRHNLLEYAELMLFLIVAMTFINAMDERKVFEALRTWLIRKGLSYRALFWVTGLLAFFISPLADNLTTVLLMSSVVLAVGGSNKQFVLLACINLVVAANAGGAFSPFGDITTLMVWQKNIVTHNGTVNFWSFFHLLLPSLVNWLVPAAIMHFSVPQQKPKGNSNQLEIKRGGMGIFVLFLLTIAMAVSFHQFLHLPPVVGMLSGLSVLMLYSYYLKMTGEITKFDDDMADIRNPVPFDIFRKIARSEWDTLFFFYGVILCVGGLGFIGYLAVLSKSMYLGLGATETNILIGIISALIDNIPVMFAVLSMMPDMSVGQWLLVTLTAGVGGSLLSIGSAAGVALMGQAKGAYTFFGHLKWMPAIALGYAASIATHLYLNHAMF
jgi:NhaD family Na+/H+ antiporter